MEFGARRAHGVDASIYGARAAYIAGAAGSSNTILGKMYNNVKKRLSYEKIKRSNY